MRIVLSGYYGFGNVGDEAVLAAIVGELKKSSSGVTITVLSASPRSTKDQYQVAAILRTDWFKIIKTLKEADLFISGGGTLLQNKTSNRSLFYYLGLIFLAKLLGKKTLILGQGFGPISGTFCNWLTKTILNQVDSITLREPDSLALVNKMKLNKPAQLTADPAHLLTLPANKEIFGLAELKNKGKPLLGIALRQASAVSEEVCKTFAQSIDWLVQAHGYFPVFLLFQCPDDMTTTSKVIAKMKENSEVIFRVCQPDEMLSIVNQLDLLIGLRLHALIFATLCQVPMLGLSYDPKVASYMQELNQPCLELGQKLKADDLKVILGEIIKTRHQIRLALKERQQQLHQRAALNFQWIK